jgi:hypothetical protein
MITVPAQGVVIVQLKDAINTMVLRYSNIYFTPSWLPQLIFPFIVYRLRGVTAEVTTVILEVGSQGKLGGQAHVPDLEGVWLDLVRNVSFLFPFLIQWQLDLRMIERSIGRPLHLQTKYDPSHMW